jgi:predicted ATPase/DNA-binding CsgD family transcriptional regulator
VSRLAPRPRGARPHAALPSDIGGNLPRELNSFVGRGDQLAHIASALQTAALVTLVGVGGVGKTRLGLRVAATAREGYAHGVWLVELARVSEPSGVASEVVRTLGIREQLGFSPVESLRSVLRARQLLLVLDNCEHVITACAELAAVLLRSCPDLCILATSREALGVAGEFVYHVPPFPVPSPDGSTAGLPEREAIDLFIDRARGTEPMFDLTPEMTSSVGRICALLDGLPLAIELAAARMTTMRPAEIAHRLGDPLSLLTLGPRSAPARQQTLRAAIDWSYQLLTEPEQTLLRRLALFRGGFTREAATSVCTDPTLRASEIDDLLDRLVAQSLLVYTKQQEHTRFHLLETVRQYCSSRLTAAGEVTFIQERHRDWCISLVEGVAVESPLGLALDAEHSRLLDPEMDNIRSALSWTIDSGQGDAAARLAVGVTSSCFAHGNFSECRSWASAVLDCSSGAPPSREMALIGTAAGVMAFNQGDFSGAEELLRRAFDLARAADSKYAASFTESRLGRLAHQRGDLREAKALLERSLASLTEMGAPWEAIAVVMGDLSVTYLELGDGTKAAELLHTVAGLATPARTPFMSTRFSITQAQLAERRGDYAEANRLLAEALGVQRALGDQVGILECLILRGTIAVNRGESNLASTLLLEALDLALSFGSKIRLARLLEALAAWLVDWQPETCVRMAAAAEQLRAALHAVPFPVEQARLGRYLQTVRQRLGQRIYGDIWAGAASVALETTVAEARETILAFQAGRAPEAAPARSGTGDALSQREREVAILVTSGLSNREIAQRLVVTNKTAEAHVAHILNKLGFTRRVQIATWGMRHGLVTPGVAISTERHTAL